LKTFCIFEGFEQLSSSVRWQVMVVQSDAKNDSNSKYEYIVNWHQIYWLYPSLHFVEVHV